MASKPLACTALCMVGPGETPAPQLKKRIAKRYGALVTTTKLDCELDRGRIQFTSYGSGQCALQTPDRGHRPCVTGDNWSQINRHDFMIEDRWNRDGECLPGCVCPGNSPADEELNLFCFLSLGKAHFDFLRHQRDEFAIRALHGHRV